MNFDSIWSTFLSDIKDELSSLAYKTWFEETKLLKIDNQKAYIIVPMPIHKKHLSEKYTDLINEKLSNIAGANCELIFLLNEEIDEAVPKSTDKVEENNNYNNDLEEIEFIDSNLKSQYTFDNFVVGNSNKFAHGPD